MTAYRTVLPRWMMAAVACVGALCGPVIVQAQTPFPAPLPGQAAPPPPSGGMSPFPPVNGAGAPAPSPFPAPGAAPFGQSFSGPGPGAGGPPAGGPSAEQQECLKAFMPLRQEAEKRAAVIKTLGQKKAAASEACKAIGNFAQAEVKMISYIKTNAGRCGIPPQVGQQMADGHKKTEEMQTRVCQVASQQQQQQQSGGASSLSEALGASTALPEATPTKRNGGSTFDTINGNVLAR